jgi:hypothetical protein
LPPLQNPPWVNAIGGQRITIENAAAYVNALKEFVRIKASHLVWNYDTWDAGMNGWYNQPWLGSIREATHGMYTGSTFDASLFPGTGLSKTFTTYVLTFYDDRASRALSRVWGSTAMTPTLTNSSAQFDEGAIIVKAAFIDITGDDWPVMKGAATWPLYVPIPTKASPQPPSVTRSAFMQFDIIVKDSRSAPKTGWVFSTLVYDAGAPGKGWDKMVPLGAMWGNDPGVDSSTNAHAPLSETWINPKAPLYSTQTLGWGGRLSGPNDGAVNDIMVDDKPMPNTPNSSCMSCHSPAEWKMNSFLLPSFQNNDPPPPFKVCGAKGEFICSPRPGSPQWLTWFQDRLGSQPMDTGTIPTDFDMVFAFKSLPLWARATGAGISLMFLPRHGEMPQDLQYNGIPSKPKGTAPRSVPFMNDQKE